MPRSVGGVSSKGTLAWGQYPFCASPPSHRARGKEPASPRTRAGQGSTLKTGIIPVMPNTSHIPNANLLPQRPHPSCLLCPSPTFGASEEQLIGGIQAEHGLGVSLCHRDTLQWGCPGILSATHGVNDAPSQERENRYSAGLERHRAHSPRAWKNMSCLTPSLFHCPAVRRAPLPKCGVSEPRSLWKPQESPRGQPLPASAPGLHTGKGGGCPVTSALPPNLSCLTSTDPAQFSILSSLAQGSFWDKVCPLQPDPEALLG